MNMLGVLVGRLTNDEFKCFGLVVGFWYLALGGYSVLWLRQPFDAVAYGTGAGAIVAAVGAAMRLRSGPQQPGGNP